ncbi:MAG TPA: DUF4097 family beta strand repeat-containing protein, partial [Bryobacteraceae bacterium]|nr:DUF4097 family beta strand repeat-containing protein [Bryobacteraceae bacterium]
DQLTEIMKRSSIVAPLLLIAIGGLFLARNMYPDVPLLDYLARYWPFLLIVWGVMRLAEVLFWASTDQPVPVRAVSGGEWVLIVLLCFVGTSVHAVHGWSRSETWWPHNMVIGGLDMFGESYDYPISGEKACSKNPHVVIENFRGDAKITAADVDSVKVTGHRSIRSLDQNGADNANRDAGFELAGDDNEVIVRNNTDKLSDGSVRLSAEMELTVPRNSTIEAHGIRGDFDIIGVNGNVQIISDNAGVRLQDIGGDAHIDLRASDIIRAIGVKGQVDLRGRGEDIDLQNIDGPVTVQGSYSGTLQFHNLNKPLRYHGEVTELSVEKIPGQLRMTIGDFMASNVIGPVHLSGRSRDVTIDDFTNELNVVVDRGDINVSPGIVPLAHMDVQTRAGNVVLSLPPSAKFDLTATTSHGDITNEYGSPLHSEDQGRGAVLRGTIAGGPAVSLHTERGEVTVRRSTSGEKSVDAKSTRESSLKKVEQ